MHRWLVVGTFAVDGGQLVEIGGGGKLADLPDGVAERVGKDAAASVGLGLDGGHLWIDGRRYRWLLR